MSMRTINVDNLPTRYHLPQTKAELRSFMQATWGVLIPDTSCCPEHTAPMTVVANAYFDIEPVQVWKASRGFGGKSWLLGVLTETEALLKGSHNTILGGSASQSRNVHEVIQEGFMGERAPKHALAATPTIYQTQLLNGGWIRALLASQRSVRGPHPQRLRMDEIDEMELGILDAALGQPMRKRRNGKVIPAQTILSSTHQYPDGTMTEILRRAGDKGWAVHQWCYRCNLTTNGGWLKPEEVEAKKLLVPQAMWDAEYELQEPSFEGRAFDLDSLERYFSLKPEVPGMPGKGYIFSEPKPHRHYVTGVDWARKRDWTVIATYDATETPWVMVAFERTNKQFWHVMVGKLNERLSQYPGVCAYDATGIGDVVGDYIEDFPNVKLVPVVMGPANRASLFSDYVAAVEHDAFRAPDIDYMHVEHKYTRTDDLFGNSKDGHPPDSVVAGALAWSQRTAHIVLVAPEWESLTKENQWDPTKSTFAEF